MSDGKTHFNWWFKFLPFSLVVSFVLMFFSFPFGMFTGVGYLLHLAVEPDSDQISLTIMDGRMMRKFGIFGVLWVMYWMPYAFVFPHRSFLSHAPVVSTIIRLVYLSIPVVVLSWYTGYFNKTNIVYIFPAIMGTVVGLSFADTIHFVLDTKLFKSFRRVK